METLPAGLYRSPNCIAQFYRRFRVSERLLLTGHSHQAWPDVGFEGQMEAWQDAAELVDDKWTRAFKKAMRVRQGFADLLGDSVNNIALGQNTHELIVRFLSSLPFRSRPRLITTDGEFHTIRRQLTRLDEEGINVITVPTDPVESIADRIVHALNDQTAAVLVSAVLFTNAHVVPGLDIVHTACQSRGVELLVDAYHAINVIPFQLAQIGLNDAFVTGGRYKYCQLGEGNCFLRVPPNRDFRPIFTGWFAEFNAVAKLSNGIQDGTGASRFAGATYDPTSHYRAAAVFDFFAQKGLNADLLHEVSQHQIKLLAERFDALDLDTTVIARDRSVPVEAIGGFLAFKSAWADELTKRLRQHGVLTDVRHGHLRLGPAPYLSDDQLQRAIELLGQAAAKVVI